VVLQRLQFRF